MKDWLRHYLNPLHVECRLVGLCKRICRVYEKVYKKIL